MSDELYSAKVPEPLVPVFLAAQKKMEDMFKHIDKNPSKGRLTIQDERYLLIRANSLATGFISEAEKVVGKEAAEMLLYNFAFAIGKGEAKGFIKKFDLKDPVEKLSAGPVYFSFVGLAFVSILPGSAPAPNDTYILVYDHPSTFEAEAHEGTADHAICFFSAGYSAGWCSESFGLELEATEISCVAKGDKSCRFIMAPYDKISSHLEQVDKYLAV